MSPCIEPSALRISSPVAQLDPQGVLRRSRKAPSGIRVSGSCPAEPVDPSGLPGNVIINVELPIYFMRLDKLTLTVTAVPERVPT